jgi:hypothetical protein
MSIPSVSRRLAAVVVVDVVSFSTMMAVDEEGTLATLKPHRNETEAHSRERRRYVGTFLGPINLEGLGGARVHGFPRS